ncbi:hypothetical protein [Streptomyces sp. NPDC004658]|uniref:hypothetical protein n=1 Tax=Streptomyces sp. NPDC004658 TaxID=3154672 RepID=UPI00339E91C4
MTEKLKPVGFYSDTSVGEAGQPTLESSRGEVLDSLEGMVSYLRNAHIIMASGSAVYDELDPDRPLIGALSIQTDGTWVWPSSYPYYVETYGVEVPSELWEAACSREWVPPTFPDDADFDEQMPFGG